MVALNSKSSEQIGRRIKQARNEVRLTQEQLADSVPISSSYMALIELGKRTASTPVLLAIADRLSITIDYLLTGNTEKIDEMQFIQWTELTKHRSVREIKAAYTIVREFFETIDTLHTYEADEKSK